MPVKTEKRKNKYRVVEVATGEVAKNASGTAIDGGGYSSKDRAVAQVQAVNLATRRRRLESRG